jgi:flagellar assembly protein FliH
MATMSSSDFKDFVLPPDGATATAKDAGTRDHAKNAVYARFIPREELTSFAAWTPESLTRAATPSDGPTGAADAASAPLAPMETIAEQLRAARHSGYQDGYRDGLSALDGFKQSYATQITAQVGRLLESHGAQLDGLQQQVAQAVAVIATSMARQVVRSELAVRPELVASVASEAVESLLLSARHITLRVHPDDLPLVALGAAELLELRGARLIGDGSIARGGVRVDSDIASIDASVATRWQRACAALGSQVPWSDSQPLVEHDAPADSGSPGAADTAPASSVDTGTP